MEKREALNKGYSFTGIYENYKEDAKARAAELKKKYGCRVVIVPVRQSGYERSAGARRGQISGYSVYACEKYSLKQSLERNSKIVNRFEEQKAKIEKEYKEKMEALNNRVKRAVEDINEIEKKLA